MAVSLKEAQDGDLGEVSEINVTPFIDVILVVLIISMVVAPLSTVDVAVDLPGSNVQSQPRPAKPVVLTVKQDLSLALGNDTVPRELLQAILGRQTNMTANSVSPARRQRRGLSRADGGDEPAAPGRLSQDRAGPVLEPTSVEQPQIRLPPRSWTLCCCRLRQKLKPEEMKPTPKLVEEKDKPKPKPKPTTVE